jgi:hypothetical protein
MISKDAPRAASMIRVDAGRGVPSGSSVQRARAQLSRIASGAAAAAFCLTVAAAAAAQGLGEKTQANRFKSAPKAPEPEDAALAAQTGDMILGIPANTIFFVAAGAIAIFWFTVGGGRKAKLERPR